MTKNKTMTVTGALLESGDFMINCILEDEKGKVPVSSIDDIKEILELFLEAVTEGINSGDFVSYETSLNNESKDADRNSSKN